MRVKRTTYEVWNEPLTILNVQRFVAFGALVALVLIGLTHHWIIGGIAFVVICGVAQYLQKEDKDILLLLPAIWFFQMARGFDPLEREPSGLIITGGDIDEEEDF